MALWVICQRRLPNCNYNNCNFTHILPTIWDVNDLSCGSDMNIILHSSHQLRANRPITRTRISSTPSPKRVTERHERQREGDREADKQVGTEAQSRIGFSHRRSRPTHSCLERNNLRKSFSQKCCFAFIVFQSMM